MQILVWLYYIQNCLHRFWNEQEQVGKIGKLHKGHDVFFWFKL